MEPNRCDLIPLILQELGFLISFYILLSFPLKPIFTNVFWLKLTQSTTPSGEDPFPFAVRGSTNNVNVRINAATVINPGNGNAPYFKLISEDSINPK